ncbi:MAG TPA: tRNA 2-thiouridine(34) synthase MnmA [Solirubrobacteraceae bacterium]|nr:tRNA 2-thiouridine(34) synthase MnmA [Solirubrobacteraceae bacterium]
MLAQAPFADHLARPLARGHIPADAFTGAAGGAACGDLVRISLALDPRSPEGRIGDVGFDASGCGAAIAAGSATVALVSGAPLLRAARVGTEQIAAELGGLHPAKRHAAELAADALHRALGAAARERAALAPVPRRTLVAMSGGVDSAVAALLTARAGEEVVGVTLELWSDPENDGERSCCSAEAVRGARALAHGQGLPHLSIDLRAEFRAGVVEPWLTGHAAGHTPNPCLRCNGRVRLDAMLELAQRLGAERLATGHYARVRRDGRDPLLRIARDPVKDQSYVLAGLQPSSLARLRFPLGDMTKDEVRALAADAGLRVARKPDSQDLCFLAGTGLGRFLERHGSGAAGAAGAIIDRAGRQLGEHRGVHAFTVGQRHGLGIGGPQPLYVLGTDPGTRTVTVGPREALRTREVAVRDVVLRGPGVEVDAVKIRSRGRRHRCRLAAELGPGEHAAVEVLLEEPIERTAPGQVACLYSGDLILGYGIVGGDPGGL